MRLLCFGFKESHCPLGGTVVGLPFITILIVNKALQEKPQIYRTCASLKKIGTFQFVFCNTPSSDPATSSATSHPRKPKWARKLNTDAVQHSTSIQASAGSKVIDSTVCAKDTALGGFLPLTSQQGADEYDRANVDSLGAIVSSSQTPSFTNTMSKYLVSKACEQANVELLNMAAFIYHGLLVNVESVHATGLNINNTTPVAPYQEDILFDLATNFSSSIFYMQGTTSPSITKLYNLTPAYGPVPYNLMQNPEVNTPVMGSFDMYFGQDNSPGFEGWDFWGHYNSNTT